MKKVNSTLLESLIDSYRSAITEVQALREEQDRIFGEAIEKINSSQDKLKDHIDSIVTQQEEYYEEKGEKWQGTDPGEAYLAWKEEYENLSSSLDEEHETDSIDFDELLGHVKTAEELNSEPTG